MNKTLACCVFFVSCLLRFSMGTNFWVEFSGPSESNESLAREHSDLKKAMDNIRKIKSWCEIYGGWKDECKNFPQLLLVVFGGILSKHEYEVERAAACMRKGTPAECRSGSVDCSWCQTKTAGDENGACLMKEHHEVFCDTAVTESKGDGRVKKDVHSLTQCITAINKERCEAFASCSYCDVPDVYGLNGIKGVCLPDSFVLRAPTRDTCEDLKNVPGGAVNIWTAWREGNVGGDSLSPTEPDETTNTSSSPSTSPTSSPSPSPSPTSAAPQALISSGSLLLPLVATVASILTVYCN